MKFLFINQHIHKTFLKNSTWTIVVRSLDVKRNIFRPQEDNEELLSFEVSYLSAIGALMYLTNNTRPDIEIY